MRTIPGGYQITIQNGVLHINTAEGSILRIVGLPMELEYEHIVVGEDVHQFEIGT